MNLPLSRDTSFDSALIKSQRNESVSVLTTSQGSKNYKPSQQEIQMIRNQISLREIYIEVFKLFKVKYWLDPNLSVKKLHAYY